MLYKFYLKRWLDFIFSTLAIILFSPILFFLMYGVLIVTKSYPLFIQKRPGLNGRIFYIYKIKTMNDKRDSSGALLPDHERLTGLGALIRRLSLDELPQLWNVVKGDMSIVGPRPLLEEYLKIYSNEQKRRHEVRPGITGWAQVNGRNAISWEQKFEYDVWYVDNCSFALDMKIFWMTVKKVFKREGISQEGQATVEKFNGHN